MTSTISSKDALESENPAAAYQQFVSSKPKRKPETRDGALQAKPKRETVFPLLISSSEKQLKDSKQHDAKANIVSANNSNVTTSLNSNAPFKKQEGKAEGKSWDGVHKPQERKIARQNKTQLQGQDVPDSALSPNREA